MASTLSGKWPVLGRRERAAEWLDIWADLGRALRTIDTYARELAEYLEACERDGVDPLTATRAQVARFVRELRTRPGRRFCGWLACPGRDHDDRGLHGLRGTPLQRGKEPWRSVSSSRTRNALSWTC